MGQLQPCCAAESNKKNLTNTNEQNFMANEKFRDGTNSNLNPSYNEFDTNQKKSSVLGNSTNANLNQNQLKTSNLTSSQNGMSLGNSVKSLKLDESINKSALSTGNPYTCIKSFEAHDEKIVSLIELSSGNIATGSYDCTIRIWDVQTQQCIKVIQESGHVLCLLEFQPNFLLSGTDNNTIQLWDINNSNKKLHSFDKHLLWVNCLVKCDDDYFASASNDSDIIIWNWEEKNCANILRGHTNCVLAMILLSNGNLCSGGADLSLKIWDWVNGTCLNTLNGHTKMIKSICQLSNGYILSGSDDKTIKVWNNLKNIKNLEGHKKSVRSIANFQTIYLLRQALIKLLKYGMLIL
jgi:WD40 repeat protein